MHTPTPLARMFIRRLLGLAAIAAAGFLLLGAQLGRLTVAEGQEHRQTAERRLDRVRFLPTYRGRILDRAGRVLAVDRPSFDVALEYEFISGTWAARRATAAAREEFGPTRWAEASPAEREAAIMRRLAEADAEAERVLATVAALGGVEREELARRIDEIKERVHNRAVAVWDRQQELERSRSGDGDPAFVRRPIEEQRDAHVVIQGVPDLVAFELQRLADRMPGTVEVQEATRRTYPYQVLEVELDRSRLPRPLRRPTPVTVTVEGVADHLLGDLREKVWPSDVRRRPFLDPKTGAVVDLGGYRPGLDRVGARGVEASQEDRLRGVRGLVRTRLDTGEVQRTEAVPGEDVALTLDIELQAMVQAILTPSFGLMRVQPWHAAADAEDPGGGMPLGEPLDGAAVVVEVDTGEILAAVSMPTFRAGLEMTSQERERRHPFVNRPFEAPYAPGSILKPLVYLGAVAHGVAQRTVRIECHGHFLKDDPTRLRCWIYRARTGFATHHDRAGGALDVVEAIARSCNIFFYTLAARLEGPRLVDWLRGFGLGEELDAGLLRVVERDDGSTLRVGEHRGFVPSAPASLGLSDVAQMGIGQGPLAWTPVQAANAYATLARGGVVRDATLVRRPGRSERREPIDLDPRAVTLALHGLHDSVTAAHGTGGRFRYEDGVTEPIVDAEGIGLWAKTGTVQASSGPDHAWFVGLVGPEPGGRPRYAIAVIVERGRSGGRSAGPVFNQIIHAMRRLGYLPPAGAAP